MVLNRGFEFVHPKSFAETLSMGLSMTLIMAYDNIFVGVRAFFVSRHSIQVNGVHEFGFYAYGIDYFNTTMYPTQYNKF